MVLEKASCSTKKVIASLTADGWAKESKRAGTMVAVVEQAGNPNR